MRIAVIGTGISGLAAAWLLREKHEVTVYEKNAYAGGHSRTLTVDYEGVSIPVDTGFIVFNHRTYPHLTKLFEHLNVDTIASNMSFAVSLDKGAFEYSGASIGGLFGQKKHLISPQFYHMLYDIMRFNRKAVALLASGDTLTLGDFLKLHRFSDAFAERYLLPMGGAIWSCSTAQMLDFPAQTFIRFFDNHGLLTVLNQPQWYTVKGGSMRYVARMVEDIGAENIRLNTPVTSVQRMPEGVMVSDATGRQEVFDHVIMATHGDEAHGLLVDAENDEQAITQHFTYEKNRVILHRDARFMPQRRACWASWVYLADKARYPDKLSLTYWMNNLQAIPQETLLFVTVNPIFEPDPALVFNDHIFTHPVYNMHMITAQAKLEIIQGRGGIWRCGSYFRYGFHEDGLSSAVHVARALGAEVPWKVIL